MAEHDLNTPPSITNASPVTPGGTSRRSLAGGAVLALLGAAAATGSASASPHPDAELIQVCAAFNELEHAFIASDFDDETPAGRADDAVRERIVEAQRPLVAHIIELRATTWEGQVARARSLALWDAELMKEGPGDVSECLTQAIIRDLLGRA